MASSPGGVSRSSRPSRASPGAPSRGRHPTRSSLPGICASARPLFGATGTVGLRILLSTIVLWAMWRPWRRLPDRAGLRALVPYGLSLGLMNLLFYLALARMTLGAAVSIEFTGPLTLAFIGSRRPVDLLWAALVLAGLALLLRPAEAVAGELRKHSSDLDCRKLAAALRAIGPLFATL